MLVAEIVEDIAAAAAHANQQHGADAGDGERCCNPLELAKLALREVVLRWFGMVGHRCAAEQAPTEFIAPAPLLAVGCFVVNNVWGKRLFPGFVTGKLSDLLACYFLPLFLSACLFQLGRWPRQRRVLIGCTVTVLLMLLLKSNHSLSGDHDRIMAALWRPLGWRPAPNRVDPTDLLALPMVWLAWLSARKSR